MAQLRSLGSRQILNEPSFFGTTTIELIQGVGSSTGEMIPCCVRSPSVSEAILAGPLGLVGVHAGLVGLFCPDECGVDPAIGPHLLQTLKGTCRLVAGLPRSQIPSQHRPELPLDEVCLVGRCRDKI